MHERLGGRITPITHDLEIASLVHGQAYVRCPPELLPDVLAAYLCDELQLLPADLTQVPRAGAPPLLGPNAGLLPKRHLFRGLRPSVHPIVYLWYPALEKALVVSELGNRLIGQLCRQLGYRRDTSSARQLRNISRCVRNALIQQPLGQTLQKSHRRKRGGFVPFLRCMLMQLRLHFPPFAMV